MDRAPRREASPARVVRPARMLYAILQYRLDVVVFTLIAFVGMGAAHAWLRRTGRAGGAPRVAWLALALLIVGGTWLAEYSGDQMRDTLRGGMESFARTYAGELEQMGHARVTWDTSPDDPGYLAMVAAEIRWLRENPTVNDIYTFRARPDGMIAFVVDSETDYDHNGRYEGEREGRTPIGETFPQADENMARALRGDSAFNAKPMTDRWGTWVNAYVPLCDPSDPFGRVNAALGVDYDAAGWTATILTRRVARLAGCTLLACILAAATASVTALRAEVARRADAESALGREEERFRLAAQCASDVIFEWDVVGGGLRWFGGAGGQLGFAEGQFPLTIGEWERAIHPDDRDRVVTALKRHLADGTPYCEEYRISTADGSTHDWVDRGIVVQPEAGGPRLMIGAVSDVTGRNRARALEAEREGLRKAVHSMEQVLGVVGHELRTPLAGVRAMSELLLAEGAAQVQDSQHFLASIHGEVVRMAGTVNDLLEAARINSGLARWNWSTFRPGDVCREAVETVRPLMAGSEVGLSLVDESANADVGVSAGDGPMSGDADAVRRLVLSLLDNARQHTTSGNIRLTVRRRRDDEGHAWAEIEVVDTGAGIPPEIVERLGQAFGLNAGLLGERYVKGAGLGLAICKGIVQAHGGFLRVRSELGAGTSVAAALRADLSAPAPGSGTALAGTLPESTLPAPNTPAGAT